VNHERNQDFSGLNFDLPQSRSGNTITKPQVPQQSSSVGFDPFSSLSTTQPTLTNQQQKQQDSFSFFNSPPASTTSSTIPTLAKPPGGGNLNNTNTILPTLPSNTSANRSTDLFADFSQKPPPKEQPKKESGSIDVGFDPYDASPSITSHRPLTDDFAAFGTNKPCSQNSDLLKSNTSQGQNSFLLPSMSGSPSSHNVSNISANSSVNLQPRTTNNNLLPGSQTQTLQGNTSMLLPNQGNSFADFSGISSKSSNNSGSSLDSLLSDFGISNKPNQGGQKMNQSSNLFNNHSSTVPFSLQQNPQPVSYGNNLQQQFQQPPMMNYNHGPHSTMNFQQQQQRPMQQPYNIMQPQQPMLNMQHQYRQPQQQQLQQANFGRSNLSFMNQGNTTQARSTDSFSFVQDAMKASKK